jgi:hypothetical protein
MQSCRRQDWQQQEVSMPELHQHNCCWGDVRACLTPLHTLQQNHWQLAPVSSPMPPQAACA